MNKSTLSLLLLVALTPIRHSGQRIAEGQSFPVETKHAEPLLRVGAAREATDDEKNAYVAEHGDEALAQAAAKIADQGGGEGGSAAGTKTKAKAKQ